MIKSYNESAKITEKIGGIMPFTSIEDEKEQVAVVRRILDDIRYYKKKNNWDVKVIATGSKYKSYSIIDITKSNGQPGRPKKEFLQELGGKKLLKETDFHVHLALEGNNVNQVTKRIVEYCNKKDVGKCWFTNPEKSKGGFAGWLGYIVSQAIFTRTA